MKKGDNVRVICLVIGYKKYVLLGQVHQMLGTLNLQFVDDVEAAVGKYPQKAYQGAF